MNRGQQKSKKLIYVVAGKETALVNDQSNKLIEQLLKPQQRETCLFKPDPARSSISEVLDELWTLPFLAEKKVVLISMADDFISQNRSLLEKYFDKPSPTAILILTAASWPATTRLAKKLSGTGELISITEPKRGQLPFRLIEYTKDAHNKILSKTAAESLIELSGDSLARLYSEIDKLALFADNEKSITPHHIESLIGNNRSLNCFAVIDAVTAGKVGIAINHLRKMFADDRSAEFTVVGAFAFHFRRMFGAKVLIDKGVNSNKVAGIMRIWGQKEAFFAQLRKISLSQIGEYLQQLAATDYAIKTGRTKTKVAMEQLVLKMSACS